MDLDYENIFKIPIRAMRINRSHPAVKRDRKWICHFLFYHGLFSLVFLLLVYNIFFHNLKSNDFDETCKNGVLSVVFVVVTFQFCIMLWKQDLLSSLMMMMKQDYERAKFLSENEQEVMLKFAKDGVYVCKQWLMISISACGIFPVKNVFLHSYHWMTRDPKLIPMYDLIYPGVIEENKENIFVYFAMYSILLYYGLYSMCMYTAFVPLGPIFMLHACGQLEIVEKKIEKLFNDIDEAEKKLKEIVQQLQYIYSFVDQILLTFRVAYELTLKATTIILPITCYEVIEAFKKGEVALEFITFIIGGVLISSSPCFYSDLLMEKGENVRLAVYSCGWELVENRKIRSTIQLILMRALKPIAIRTLFRTVCLDALTDVSTQSPCIYHLLLKVLKCQHFNTFKRRSLPAFTALPSGMMVGEMNLPEDIVNYLWLFQQSYAIFNLMNAMWE